MENRVYILQKNKAGEISIRETGAVKISDLHGVRVAKTLLEFSALMQKNEEDIILMIHGKIIT